VQPRRLHVPDQPAPLGVCNAVAGACLSQGQRRSREDKEGTTHRQVLDQGPVDVQGAFQIADRHAVDARPGRQIDGDRIGSVQADHVASRFHDIAGSMSRDHAVTKGESGSALDSIHPAHAEILSPAGSATA